MLRFLRSQGSGIKELRGMYPKVHINIATDAEPGNEYRKVTVTGVLQLGTELVGKRILQWWPSST